MRLKAHQLQQFLDALLNAIGRPAFDLRHYTDVASDSEVGEEADFLNHISDHAAQADYIPIAYRATVDLNLAFALFQQTIDEFEGRGFAGAAAAQQDQGFAAKDFEIQVAQEGVTGFEAIGDVAEFDGCTVTGRVAHRSGYFSTSMQM